MTTVKKGIFKKAVVVEPPPITGFVEEFNGPYSSWLDVVTRFGAKGDGVADDTVALQNAINFISSSNTITVSGFTISPRVLYLPEGAMFRITSTLTNSGLAKPFMGIVGGNPVNTSIKWDGVEGGAMINFDGVRYSHFGRITLDGQGGALSGIEHKWTGSIVGSSGVTHNCWYDAVFKNMKYGMRAGTLNKMDAETPVYRCKFINCAGAGFSVESFNALDWWFWDCEFSDCGYGLTNNSTDFGGAGNFNVYNSIFRRSVKADIHLRNSGFFGIEGNYSINSKAFLTQAFNGTNAGPLRLENNTVIDPLDTTCIDLSNYDSVFFRKNKIRSRADASVSLPVVRMDAGDGLILDNEYTHSNKYTFGTNSRQIIYNDSIVSRGSIDATEPTLSPTPLKVVRPVVDVFPQSTAAASNTHARAKIEDWKTIAASGQKPVLHPMPGNIQITQPINMGTTAWEGKWEGDGYDSAFMTSLSRTTFGAAPMVTFGKADKMQFVGIHFKSTASNSADKVNGLSLGLSNAANKTAVLKMVACYNPELIGKTLVVENGTAQTRIECMPHLQRGSFMELYSCLYNAYGRACSQYTSEVKLYNSYCYIRDQWYESGNMLGYLQLDGTMSGEYFQVGSKLSPAYDFAEGSTTTRNVPYRNFVLDNFQGNAGLIGSNKRGIIEVKGDGSATGVLLAGNLYYEPSLALDNTSPNADVASVNNRPLSQGGNLASTQVANSGITDASFITSMLQGYRSQTMHYRDSEQVGLYMHRIRFEGCNEPLRITKY
jgi:hypothetical protein